LPTVVATPVPTEPNITPVPVTSSVALPTVVATPVPTEPNITSVPVASSVVLPTIVATSVPTIVQTPEVTPIESNASGTENLTNETELSGGVPEPSPTATQKAEDNRMIYSGVLPLPEGMVNITDSAGVEYEIPVNTPLGILQMLLMDKKVQNICINDRGMHKGGILILEGINEFFNTATKVWFVRVNGNLLEDYANPKTDGLNIFSLMAGDTVSYYYGDPAGSLQDAEAVIVVTLG